MVGCALTTDTALSRSRSRIYPISTNSQTCPNSGKPEFGGRGHKDADRACGPMSRLDMFVGPSTTLADFEQRGIPESVFQ